jgi:hypothetical protein
MRRFVITVFDEWVYDSAAYTSNEHDELLASVDALGIQAIVDAVSSLDSPTLSVDFESSADGRHWESHSTPIEVAELSTTATTVAVGTITPETAAAVHALARARLKITLGGESSQARVRLVVCGRDTARGAASPGPPRRAS